MTSWAGVSATWSPEDGQTRSMVNPVVDAPVEEEL
jgi:hypothetical protein